MRGGLAHAAIICIIQPVPGIVKGDSMANCKKCRGELPEGAAFCCWCGAKQDAPERKPKARGNGEGTVVRLPSGKYAAIITTGFEVDESGKLRQIRRKKSGFKTRKAAEAYIPTLKGEKSKRGLKTWGEIYEAWEPTHRAGKSTMDCYRAARKYFTPLDGEYMAEITVDDLQECIDDCPKGKRTKENMKALAGLMFKYAIPRHQADMNMAEFVRIWERGGPGKDGLPQEALEAIEKAVGAVRGADYVLCQCYTGFRPSELLALDMDGYNRAERTFTGGAKTEAGRDRVVPIHPKIQPIVDRLTRNRIGGPVFPGPGGGRMDIQAYRELFYGVLDAVGVENPITEVDGVKYHKYTPHSCRHTFATLLKHVDGAEKDKLAIMGHTSGEMLRHYQDVPLDDLRAIIQAI